MCDATESPRAARVAFQAAVSVAKEMALTFAINDSREENWVEIDKTIGRVRRALMDAQVADGQINADLDLTDYDGDRVRDRISGKDKDADDYWHQLNVREESGYLYGLAMGLLLGRGGAR